MNDLNVCIVQPNIIWEDHAANLKHYEEILKENLSADLIILPEMFSSGFAMPPKYPLKRDNLVTKWMADFSENNGVGIMGSVPIAENSTLKNRLYFFGPNNQFHFYDKRHLFGMAKEDRFFSRGSSRLVIPFNGWKIHPQICYDLRFPVWSRNNLGYDLLVYAANWPDKRIEAWKALLVARAIENVSYVIGVNRVGTDPFGNVYPGQSMVVSPTGEVLKLLNDRPQVLNVSLSGDAIAETRKKFPFLNDGDDFSFPDIPASK